MFHDQHVTNGMYLPFCSFFMSCPEPPMGTLNSAYNKKKYAEILLHYRQLFVKDDVFIGEWHVFGAEVFLHYSHFFVKCNFVIGRVECTSSVSSFQVQSGGSLILFQLFRCRNLALNRFFSYFS